MAREIVIIMGYLAAGKTSQVAAYVKRGAEFFK